MVLNTLNCSLGMQNTGYGDCYAEFKDIRGMMLVPLKWSLDAADLATKDSVLAALEAGIINNVKSQRLFPTPPIIDVVDNSEEAVTETLGTGVPVPVREGNYNWRFRFSQGGLCALKALQSFNGVGRAVVFFDANGTLIGTKSGSEFKGIPLHFFNANKWTLNTGAANWNLSFSVSFSPEFVNQNAGFIPVGLGELQSLIGLQNVNLTATRTTNVITVKAKTGCSGYDLYDEYATELAAVGMWSVQNAQTGNLVTITSVAQDPNARGWTITLSTADADYDVAGDFIVNGATVSVWNSAGITGYEALPVTVD